MLTLYTAVGSLQFVNVNGKEYGMSKEELLVWSCLAFQILTYPELERLFLPEPSAPAGASGKRDGGKRRGCPVPAFGDADHHTR